MTNPNASMSLTHHLSELRSRLISFTIFFTLFFIVCWFFSENILNWIAQPISPYLKQSEGHLIFTAPMDEFLAHIRVAFFGALVLSFPIFIFHLWKFLSPGLYKKEKIFFISLHIASTVLFFSGILFIYFIVYPLSFNFLMNVGSSMALISVKEYLSFFILTTLIFGLLFETPLIILGLVWVGVLSIQQLKHSRRYAIVILAVISAVVTPPDIISMIFLLLPLYLLYEMAIFTAGLLFSSKK
ncbi:MAG: twin-arginine translocase subunit TatC [Bdellovibrionales bacterium]|nr:twin-arginine translocase subunit TatC [Bdellovibrionales bacterium]